MKPVAETPDETDSEDVHISYQWNTTVMYICVHMYIATNLLNIQLQIQIHMWKNNKLH